MRNGFLNPLLIQCEISWSFNSVDLKGFLESGKFDVVNGTDEMHIYYSMII